MLRQIEVEIEARQVASGLKFGFINQWLREHHSSRLVMRMR